MSTCMGSFKHFSSRQLLPTGKRFANLNKIRPFSQAVTSRTQFVRVKHGSKYGASPYHQFPIQSQRFQKQSQRLLHGTADIKHRAFIALGSNMGDRVAMIEQACNAMELRGKIKLVRTSSLWETKAMYVLDQSHFVNGACEIETSLLPLELLDELQAIENDMGRVKVIDKGPRNIDLDILLYDGLSCLDDRLQIPHALMFEREFVLRPLCEILQEYDPQTSQVTQGSLQSRLEQLPTSEEPISPMTPLAKSSADMPVLQSQRQTLIMSILNVTPDSFSDGGKNYKIDQGTLASTIKSHISSGATIIDVGGQSTRPGAIQVSMEEELGRILPTVKLIRSLPEAKNVAISVDTYRAAVAEAAIKAGADMINDVSAGMMDDAMLPTVAKLGCTICMMHMRGTPETMNSLTSYPDGIVETVGKELLERVSKATESGIRHWRIILDPGIGFAKTQEHNLELLRRLDDLRKCPGLGSFPWVIGTSRKAFVGKITGMEKAKDRIWGTAAAVTAAIQGGADIVRVHDVEEMSQVARMADAVWRR